MIKSRAFLIACFAAIAGIGLAASFTGSMLSVHATAPARSLTVVKAGSATGSVVASIGLINCGAVCVDLIAGGTLITLTATSDANSQFTGWLGPCTGTGSCNFAITGDSTATATFAPKSLGIPRLDIDGTTTYHALTDGILLIRYLFGLTGQGLIAGAGTTNPRFTGALATSEYNRRFNLPALLDRLTCIAVRAVPRPRSALKIDYVAG